MVRHRREVVHLDLAQLNPHPHRQLLALRDVGGSSRHRDAVRPLLVEGRWVAHRDWVALLEHQIVVHPLPQVCRGGAVRGVVELAGRSDSSDEGVVELDDPMHSAAVKAVSTFRCSRPVDAVWGE